ncbi:MAG TPA: hypothetical protein VFE47_05695 [Tepidisphaeraceae bacterium]|jgi:hypothetical protein|nr:hypothetical protein [Tepidisphaeraceae bacterium]
MQADRNAGGHDGTVLFEHFCASVATNFLGGPAGTSAFVFGTGRVTEELRDADQLDESQFEQAVNNLCKNLKEGFGFSKHPESKVTAKDGKLDVVAWRGFADERLGRLIVFGQCKTGTHWEGDLTKLSPQTFCDKWLKKAFAVLPLRLYFVADRVLTNWYDRTKDAGIIFDRCRLMQYAEPLEQSLFSKIRDWTEASAKSEGINL